METPRFLKPPQGTFFLLGPRGTGKSWWIRKTFPHALVVDLLDPATLREPAPPASSPSRSKTPARSAPAISPPSNSFALDYPEARRALIYRGTDTLLVDGITCLPAEKFLQHLQPDTPPLPGL